MDGLRIAPGLSLPPEIITDTIAIFGTRGSGKSTSGTVLVEEAHALDLPTVVVDPKGDWWGLRSSADGKAGGGLPFIIFGGDHADVPLEPTAGQLLADLIVDQRINAVLDLSAMSKTSQRRFAMDFAERLYRRNREALLVVVDEADIVIPQRVSADMLRLLGAWEDIAKRGRGRGLGLAVLTQRPQDVAKSVLDEMHALLLHGMVGPRAMKSIREWVDNHADDGAPTAEILGSLGSLEPGEGWMWAPFRHIRQRIRVRRIRTFDSHATPKPGQVRAQPRARAVVDLAALGEQITATVERAKADDPKTLRAENARLQRELAAERARPAPEPVERIVEVPVLEPGVVDQLEAALGPAVGLLAEMQETLAKHRTWEDQIHARRPPAPPVRAPAAPAARPATKAAIRPTDPATGDLRSGARRMVEALGRMAPLRLTKSQWGTVAHLKTSGGTWSTYLSDIRRAGFLDEDHAGYTLTAAGFDYIGGQPDPMTATELQNHYRQILRAGAATMLDALITAHPAGLTRDDLGAAAGLATSGGTFSTYLSDLTRNGLADRAGDRYVATDILMYGAQA